MLACRRVLLALGIGLASLIAYAPPVDAAAPQSLGRSFEKLQKEKKLKIGYLGGAITAGEGVANPWRAHVTAWFQAQDPQSKVTEVNAAAAGGSELGAFRFRKDIMAKDPDLLFIEFAVDDADHDEQRTLRSLEGIVRQFWTTNPWAEIVFVYATNKRLAAGYEQDARPKATGYHRAVAKHYGIPEIDVGRELVDAIRSGKATWESLTTDGTQPNEAGTAIYRRAIESFLEAHRNAAAAEPRTVLPEPLVKDPFSGAYVAEGTGLYAPGWRKVTKPEDSQPRHIEADAVGSELEHVFTGSTIGLLLLVGPDGGDLEWSIDDGPTQRLSTYEPRSDTGPRTRFLILADNLAAGREHKLIIRISAEKSPQATGHRVRLATIVMHCDC